MGVGTRLLAISRPLFYLLLFSLYIAETDSWAMGALYAGSLSFYIATSAVIVGWLPAPRRWRVVSLYLEIIWTTILATLITARSPGGPMPALFSPIFVSLYFDLERPWLRPTLLGTSLLWLATFIPELPRASFRWVLIQVGIFGAFNLFSAAMGSLMRDLVEEKERSEALLRQVQQSQTALERAHRQLQASAAQQQELAVLEERQRLAREIHDSVAHSLTALVVQIQAARRTLERKPEQAVERLISCEETARQALQETRMAVRALHLGLEQQSEVEALRRLGRDFGAATGIDVTLEADEGALALPPDPQRLEQLYRIFQEALTNAHRHGQAQRVSGRLAVADDQLILTIRNDGVPPRTLAPGMGLRSMAERARSLGGALSLEPGESGLTVRVTLPAVRGVVE